MSDAPDKHEKIHDPTPRRLQKAREEGNVFRSREIISVGMLMVGLGVLAAGLPLGFASLKRTTAFIFQGATTTHLTTPTASTLLAELGLRIAPVMLPFFAALLVAAVGFNVMQSGWNVSMKPLQPKGNRISPLQGFKRIFSTQGLFNVGKSLAKIVIVGPIAYFTITDRFGEILMLHTLPMPAILSTAGGWVLVLVGKVLLVLLLLSGVDFAFEKWKYKADLKMTTKEVKDEAKESEGDPQMRGKRRQLAQAMARRPRLDHAVLKGDVVITNPTHYAVVLRYDPLEAPAPRVLVKGIRKRAQRIKELATEHGIPMIEDRPLARALYSAVEEDQEIPEDLYPAVAAILAEVFRQREGWL